MTYKKSLGLSVVIATVLLSSSTASAEPLLVDLELTGAMPLTEPQRSLFGPGGSVAASLLYPLHPVFLMGIRLRMGLLLNGSAPEGEMENWADPDMGGFGILNAVLRLRPFASSDDMRRGTGFFLEAAGGGAITGELQKVTFDGGLGWGFELGIIDLAPTVRYLQIVHDGGLDSRDARILLFGVAVSFFDDRPVEVKPPEPPKDTDKDGIVDMEDDCPTVPEDHDDFQDEDGCPEPDNDNDNILDGDDSCPNEPEDFDEFEDEDGCPDTDNDNDSFPDANDECPNEAEIINGNKDYDGCPDEGLIEMVNDRIVLEEKVLFDLSRSRVKSRARPVLQAIRDLQQQHPEWISLRIEGHSDIQGDQEFNQKLSERRAQNVRKELLKLGIPESMIDAVGYGSTRLRDKRDTEEAHHRNRRVEFVVMARYQPPSAESESQPKAEEVLKNEKPGTDALQPDADTPKDGVQPQDKKTGGEVADDPVDGKKSVSNPNKKDKEASEQNPNENVTNAPQKESK